MDIKDVLTRIDHTLLSQTATLDDIKSLCDDARRFKTASVCIAPSFVKEAKAYVGESVKICTVIGFPNGYSTQAVKCFEARDAIENGADEIDMVINIGLVKDKRFDDILSEIKAVKEACGDKVLKVIIETCLLSEDEKIRMCKIVSDSGADFIKTSTGFSTAGATFEDVALLKKHCAPHLKIKAAGGISSIADAEKFIELSAERLGTSRIVKILKQKENENAKALSDTAY
ncbi:MAG: deoxyribose-phosphate aldolase [Oscillospiraceae bacterium]|nr:deoxyribose-phosphate aldolase [Oscillospiraceae bacterium]